MDQKCKVRQSLVCKKYLYPNIIVTGLKCCKKSLKQTGVFGKYLYLNIVMGADMFQGTLINNLMNGKYVHLTLFSPISIFYTNATSTSAQTQNVNVVPLSPSISTNQIFLYTHER